MRRAWLLVLVGSTPAAASTPSAWAAMHKAASVACIKASGLKAASASAPVDMSDQAGTFLIITGTYSQPFMKGAKGTMLCRYDRGTRRAETVEAKGWTARP